MGKRNKDVDICTVSTGVKELVTQRKKAATKKSRVGETILSERQPCKGAHEQENEKGRGFAGMKVELF